MRDKILTALFWIFVTVLLVATTVQIVALIERQP